MRIAVVANSEAQLELAGTRIRYRRIAPYLASMGHLLELTTIGSFRFDEAPRHDVYLFSKCQDVRSVMMARLLRSRGARIGIDGFDDYFSQGEDSRLVRQRAWLNEVAPYCDFFLCSTPRMQTVLSTYLPDVPGHVLNDPHDAFSPADVASSIEARLDEMQRTRRIPAAWFGVGDNPQFAVGVPDLVAQAPRLGAFREHGFLTDLTILTNRRALTADALSALRRLDVDSQIAEWTLEAEVELLRRSLVAFLPVNAQPFSIAKSLNRAVTALTAGVQVLSPNYPLYEPLDPFVYRSADELARDLRVGRPRLRPSTLPDLLEMLSAWGDPFAEAKTLAAFLGRLPGAERRDDWPEAATVVLAGVRSPAIASQLAHRMRQLTVGGLFGPGKVDDDVQFVRRKDEVRLRLSPNALERLDERAARLIAGSAIPLVGGGKEIRLSEFGPGADLAYRLAGSLTALTLISDYSAIIAQARHMLEALLPGLDILLSESEPPFAEAVR